MADTITSSKSVAIGVEYPEGGDTKKTTITLPNYRSSVTEQGIKDAFNNQQVIIYGYNDQYEPQYVTPEQIYTASTTNQTIKNIDIGWE